MTAIVGISTACDASSAAVVVENDEASENRSGNRVASAIEQFKIREHARSADGAPLPEEAIRTSLEIAGVDASDVGLIAIIGDVESTEKLIPHIRRLGLNVRATIEPVDHRAAHAAAAFYSSPFDRAAIIIPGGTESGGICLAVGHGARIQIDETPEQYSALRTLYDRISSALGFHRRSFSKVAWLGAGGEPEFLEVFSDLMTPDGGAARIDRLLKALNFARPQNVAASLQAWTNGIIGRMAADFCRRLNLSNLCVAGFLAENPLLVRELEQQFGHEGVFVPPAPGSELLCIGAALACSARKGVQATESRFIYPALGPEFPDSQIKAELDNCKLVCSFFPALDALVDETCRTLLEGGLIGWFQGRCEFGHRALGFRSIVANPFTPYIDENINRFLKQRESFHPFVISVAEESAPEYFEHTGTNARTIASVYAVRDTKKSVLSKFTIGDRYVRVHTVNRTDNPPFWTLLHNMKALTGHPLLINTSFNLPSEPLVMTPRDAIRTFYASGLDVLAIGRFLLRK